jgi:hypothetical protein
MKILKFLDTHYMTVLLETWPTCSSSFLASLELLLEDMPDPVISMAEGDILTLAVRIAATYIDDLKDEPVFRECCKKNVDFAVNVMVVIADPELNPYFVLAINAGAHKLM